MLLVLHDQDALATLGHALAASGSSITPGRVMVKVEPRSGPGLSAAIVPRWPFTTELHDEEAEAGPGAAAPHLASRCGRSG